MTRADHALLKFDEEPTPWDPNPARPDYNDEPWRKWGTPYVGPTCGQYYSPDPIPADVLQQPSEQLKLVRDMATWELQFADRTDDSLSNCQEGDGVA